MLWCFDWHIGHCWNSACNGNIISVNPIQPRKKWNQTEVVSDIFLHEPRLMIFLLDAPRVLVTIKPLSSSIWGPTNRVIRRMSRKICLRLQSVTPCRLLFTTLLTFCPILSPFLRKYLFTSSICHHLLSTFSWDFFGWKISLLASKSITCLLLDL